MKKYLNAAITYSLVALILGVFYREFTKFSGFEGTTQLSLLHVHYLSLGLFFFLFLAIIEKLLSFSSQKGSHGFVVAYHIGLNITGLGLLLRGISEVAIPELSAAADASISGVSGMGHVLLGVSLVALLFKFRKAA